MEKVLWLLECRWKGGTWGRLYTFYAEDEKEAQHLAEEYLAERPNLVYIRLEKCYHGFTLVRTRLPGHINL